MPLPDERSFETGAAIACGTGTAYGALRRLNLSGRDTIAIFGQGPVGSGATQLAVAMGALDIIADRGIEVDRLFSDRDRALSDAVAAYELFDTQTTGKGVFLL